MKKLFLFLGIIVIGALLVSVSGAKKAIEPVAPTALPTPVIELSDGDTYDMNAGYVTKNIDGKTHTMMAYNGSIPGPTIKVKQGAQVTIRFKNDLKEKTLLHSHGVRMQNPFDGSQLTQKEMEPGQTYEYKLRFPDPGVFWYHPHVREDKQQPLGLYGNFVVEPTDTSYWAPADRDVALTLGDILIEDSEIAPYSDKFITHALMGRFGNTLLVNGLTAASTTISAKPGNVLRFYLTNVSATRPYQFRITGGAKMKLVGGDSGRIEHERFVESIMITPSERYVLDVYFPTAGTYRMEHSYPGKTYSLGTVEVSGTEVKGEAAVRFSELRNASGTLADEFAKARTFTNTPPDKTLRLTLKADMNAMMNSMGGMQGMPMNSESMPHSHGGGATTSGMVMGNMQGAGMMGGVTPDGVEWEDVMGAMNIFSTDKNTKWILRDDATGKENMDVVWKLKLGELVKIRLENDKNVMHPMQHPIHFHGNRFVVLSRNGMPNDNMVWKDTTFLKPGDQLDILLEASNPGRWMAHCHIAEHLHSGMMMEFDVE